jgi:hypothetical protein
VSGIAGLLVAVGFIGVACCVVGLWIYAAMAFNARQPLWGLLAFVAGALLTFATLVVAERFWE